MDHVAAMEERIVTDKIMRKLEEANVAAQNQIQPIQDHVNFTLQQAYFKCAYECFDRRRRQAEINDCVEHCSTPVLKANNLVENEMSQFQFLLTEDPLYRTLVFLSSLTAYLERMNRSLMVCKDKFEAAKLQKIKAGAIGELESCVSQSVDDNIRVLPHILDRLKNSLSIS
ncbi:hypothetical protein AXF42_Ash011175 [Apostasia shenzhenica]|uniref:Protein FAM136A n=1 Tax=Apostasia shenzhenica TaxID=1088818 RepID=A0A2I0AL56_9ASPA|nr:hypothetical protein AXF42_Ash011175 [Apostasia shenzhenica]